MKALSFEIGGKTAIFKKPDVNSYAYFTYNNIHKPALLGILGAIIGLKGYTQLFDEKKLMDKKIKEAKAKDKKELQEQKKILEQCYPQYYQKLKDLKVSIVPLAENKRGYFTKKIQVFNNSVGYASGEAGGNLVVREQWLENPKWLIMILNDDSEEYQNIKEYLLNQKAVYTPYLGKNDHFANIQKAKEIELTETEGNYIDSLFIKNCDDIGDGWSKDNEIPFIFQEVSPIRLQKEFHFYEYETLLFTNHEVENLPNDTYGYQSKNYSFI
jgi:CRISPR-associated protein Cas5h